MDKHLNNLDPKLKEAYERVMATTIDPRAAAQKPNPAAQPEPSAQVPNMAETQANQPLMQTAPVEAAPQVQQIPVQPPTPQNYTNPLPTQNPFIQTPEPPAMVLTKAEATKSKSGALMPVIFLIGGLVFFAAYAFIWAKIFGLV